MRAIAVFLLCLAALAWASPDAHADSLKSVIMPGKVIKGHADLETDCEKCHVRFKKNAQTGLCQDCHKDVAQDIARKRGYHGRIKEQECRACHTEHKGRDFNIAAFNIKQFDHRLTDFALKGAHARAKVACVDCHPRGKKHREAPGECVACHKKDDKHKGALGSDCASCHNERNWKETRFNHAKTKFPLLGKHIEVACKSCHKDPAFKGAPTACVACHKKDDKHKMRFGTKCESCHTDKDWKAIIFDHGRETRYVLRGSHKRAKCESCHTQPLFVKKTKLRTECFACHQKDDKHKGQEGKRCESCHDESTWKNERFDHDFARFPLLGRHTNVKCKACHSSLRFKETKSECAACHLKADAHKGRLGPQCEQCHNARSWKQWQFNHNKQTRFRLDGGHRGLKCESCHTRAVTRTPSLSATCSSCHRDDDAHDGSFGQQCERCHVSTSWKKLRPGVANTMR